MSRWMHAAAAVAGTSHEAAGLPCQDRVAGRAVPGATAMALADGAGSASRSEAGAARVVEAALDLAGESFEALRRADEDEVKTLVLDRIKEDLGKTARLLQVPVGELASTLLLVAVRGQEYVAVHLGDGLVAAVRRGRPEALTRPVRGEFVNETVLTTSSGARDALQVRRGVLEDASAFAVLSDGAAESLYLRREGTVGTALEKMAAWLDSNAPGEVSAALERHLRGLFRQRTGDDVSLGILSRVALPLEALAGLDPSFLGAFLAPGEGRVTGLGTRNRLRVLEAFLDEAGGPPSREVLARRSGLSPSTAGKHLRDLRRWLDIRKEEGREVR